MIFSDQQLKEIENFGSIFFKVSDIAVALDIDEDELREELALRSSPAARAYRRGIVSTKARIQLQETKLAFIGSPLALENVRRNLIDMEDDE